MAYLESGSGKTILLLHGNSASKSTFKKHQFQHFKEFHTIAVDSRGHGQSQSDDHILTFDQMSDDIIQLCDRKNLRNIYALGHSDGGILGLYLIIKRPDLFQQVFLVSPNYKPDGLKESSMKLIMRFYGIVNTLNKIGFPLQRVALRIALMLNDYGLTAEDLQKINGKIALIFAEKDMITDKHMEEMAKLIPSATYLRIQGTTHMNVISHPELIQLVRDSILAK